MLYRLSAILKRIVMNLLTPNKHKFFAVALLLVFISSQAFSALPESASQTEVDEIIRKKQQKQEQ